MKAAIIGSTIKLFGITAVMFLLLGCQTTGLREVGGGGVQTLTTSDDPMLALNHKATVSFWKSFRSAVLIAKRNAEQDHAVFKDWSRYATGISMLHAGQGGNVKGTTYTWGDLANAIENLDRDTRRRVANQIADTFQDAANATDHRPDASKKFENDAVYWRKIAESLS